MPKIEEGRLQAAIWLFQPVFAQCGLRVHYPSMISSNGKYRSLIGKLSTFRGFVWPAIFGDWGMVFFDVIFTLGGDVLPIDKELVKSSR